MGPFLKTWMDQRLLYRVKSGREKQTLNINAYRWNLEQVIEMISLAKQKLETQM